ncbi:MAG TPA: trypsin-like serine protease [Catenuloplanes sp.]
MTFTGQPAGRSSGTSPGPGRHRRLVSAALLAATIGGGFVAPAPAQAIAGGSPIQQGSYQFLAKLNIGEDPTARACSGALVQLNWVLTAKSCLAEGDKPVATGVPGRVIRATIGRESRAVLYVVPHADRNLALVRLDRDVPVAPVQFARSEPVVGEVVRAAGYGRTATEWVPDNPHAATFHVDEVNATTLTMSGNPATASICKGDAGGPTLREQGGRVELLAIHASSTQQGCLGEAEGRSRATDARVDDVSAWVSSWTSREGADAADATAMSMVAMTPDRRDLFARSRNNTLVQKTYVNGKWSDWQDLGGWITSAPAVASFEPGRMDVFVRAGSNNSLFHRFFANGSWSVWSDLGGELTSAPAVASWGPGRLDIVARGWVRSGGMTAGMLPNQLVHKTWSANGGWSSWNHLDTGGPGLNLGLTSAPTIAAWGVNRLDVFYRDADNQLCRKSWSGRWESRECYAGEAMASAPTVGSFVPGRLDVFALNARGQLLHKFFDNGRWSVLGNLGGRSRTVPAVVGWSLGAEKGLDLLSEGASGDLEQLSWNSKVGWIPWQSRGPLP